MGRDFAGRRLAVRPGRAADPIKFNNATSTRHDLAAVVVLPLTIPFGREKLLDFSEPDHCTPVGSWIRASRTRLPAAARYDQRRPILDHVGLKELRDDQPSPSFPSYGSRQPLR